MPQKLFSAVSKMVRILAFALGKESIALSAWGIQQIIELASPS
jgi:hypothetical protein